MSLMALGLINHLQCEECGQDVHLQKFQCFPYVKTLVKFNL
jgi:RNA polymerase-binding transcription factor DksA